MKKVKTYNVLTGLVHSVCEPYRTTSYFKAVVAMIYRWVLFGRGYILTTYERVKETKSPTN